jgi:hypothetical protein
MKTSKTTLTALLVTVLMAIAHSTSATTVNFTFGGAITGFSSQQTVNGVTGPLQTPDGKVLSFAVGDPFTGTAFFDPQGSGFSDVGLDIAVDGEHFVATAPNATSSLTSTGIFISFSPPFGGSNPFGLEDNFGTLSDTFGVGGAFDFNGLGGIGDTGFHSFRLTGDITSFQSVPDAGSTATLLSVGLIGVAALRRKLVSVP